MEGLGTGAPPASAPEEKKRPQHTRASKDDRYDNETESTAKRIRVVDSR